MAITNKITIGDGNEVIELKGAELDAFLEQRAKDQAEVDKIKKEQEAQNALKVSAYKKLGLTDEEIGAIL